MSIKEIFESMEYGPAPESASEALAWIASHDGRFGCHIGGAFQAPGETFPSRNPATGATLAEIAQGSRSDVDAAVAAARTAQPAWGRRESYEIACRYPCSASNMALRMIAWTPQFPSTTWVTPKSTAADITAIASSSLRP